MLLAMLTFMAVVAFAQRTPTMGWSSWNTFALKINEELIKGQADAMHQNGLQKAGYLYINIDDGYWDGRGDDGHLRLNTKLFPNGMRPLVDYIHKLGLKAGIYSDAGDNTCGSGNRNAWGIGVGFTWGADVADSWRTTGDIYDAWKSVKGILAENLYLSAYCHDGHYNDMDMLEVGRSMSQVEDETHFGLWCIMSSPLLIGCDTRNIRPESLKLLCNRDLIALNQDKLHLQAYVAEKQGECFILVKDIKKRNGKERAVAIYNPSDSEQTVRLNPATIDLGGAVQYYDCFAQQNYLYDMNPISLTIPAHGTKIFRVKGQKRLERKVYEAETAYIPTYQELRNNQEVKTGVYTAVSEASGGYKAGWLGGREGNNIQWNDVYVKKAGTRQMTITYFCGEERTMDLTVNGQRITTLKAKSNDWNHPATITVDVNLKKGRNSICLSNDSAWMPDIDKMVIN